MSQYLAQAFGFKNRDQVVLTKVRSVPSQPCSGPDHRHHATVHQLSAPLPTQYVADHVELYFKDQYLYASLRELITTTYG